MISPGSELQLHDERSHILLGLAKNRHHHGGIWMLSLWSRSWFCFVNYFWQNLNGYIHTCHHHNNCHFCSDNILYLNCLDFAYAHRLHASSHQQQFWIHVHKLCWYYFLRWLALVFLGSPPYELFGTFITFNCFHTQILTLFHVLVDHIFVS